MVGLWIAFSLIQFQMGKTVWVPLLACSVILLVKRPGFTVELAVVEFALLMVVVLEWLRRDRSTGRNLRRFSCYAAILVAGGCYFGFARHQSATVNRTTQPDERPVVCLGDSLTAYGYPDSLTELISLPVKNFGIDGITTEDGIKMLPEMLATNPQAVVLELGGHDFKDGKSRDATRKNLVTLIEAFQNQGAEVILVEIPHGFITDPYDGLERELTAEYDLQLISDSVIRSFILNSPIMPPGTWMSEDAHLSDDGLHPNQRGNQHFAKRVATALAAVFGDKVLNKQ